MRIVTARRISQVFFTLLFLWFCLVATLGEHWWQLRGWPVNWFLELDPLATIGTALTTGGIYRGMAWGLVTIGATFFLGRFFCGWVCPFGAMHQALGFLSKWHASAPQKVRRNRYHPAQRLKYWILIFFLGAALLDSVGLVIGSLQLRLWASLQVGLLDPIPLLYRSFELIVLPMVGAMGVPIFTAPRYSDNSLLIGVIFFTALGMNFRVPRFFCRFVCPLGALLGILSRWSLWRIGKIEATCPACPACERNCEGACNPADQIRISECVVCMNCRADCRQGTIRYGSKKSEAGELVVPDLRRREVVLALTAGIGSMAMLHLEGRGGPNWPHGRIRPPGALNEDDFLDRCLRCGQCMRVCPTNVIHPAGFDVGLEGLWTPVLNFRVGTSGCQHNCIACGHVCPTAAIRPLTQEERMGKNDYAAIGPIRIGTAFVDRGRCLPWAMKTACIVCQENCPVSPKAIEVDTVFEKTGLKGRVQSSADQESKGILTASGQPPGMLATGDYFIRIDGDPSLDPLRIVAMTGTELTLADAFPVQAGSAFEVVIRLQRPIVDPHRCIGCGVCEHECPVTGLRAIRISAENETRNETHRLLI